MRSPRLLAAIGLLLTAVAIAAANLWFAAARSMIPLALDDVVVERRVLAEKHAGIDDVYLLDLQHRGRLVVDKAVYDVLVEGSPVRKSAWSKRPLLGEQTIDLAWSADLRGLAMVMSAALVILVGMLVASSWLQCCRSLRERAPFRGANGDSPCRPTPSAASLVK